MCTSSFISFFVKNVMLKDVRHFNFFHRLNDVQIAFRILIYCFVQWPSYLLWCTLPFFNFIKSFICFDSSFLQVFGCFLDSKSLDSFKRLVVSKQVFFLIIFGDIEFILIITIALTTYLKNWALVVSIIVVSFMID